MLIPTKHAMKPLLLLAASLIAFSPPVAAQPATAPTAPAAAGDESDWLAALRSGKLSLHLRARWEHADQDGLRASDALTLRTRLGYTTAPFQGFTLSGEFEDVTALDDNAYNQAGLNPGGAGRTVIADPETTEVNQVWLGYTVDNIALKLGRQRLVFDNHRFVGDVGWRQNMQTFDAVSVQDRTLGKLTLNYAYLWRINRVFGREHPQGRWDSDSHLINASYAGLPVGTLTGYAYLLDFDDAAENSSATFGLSLAGSRESGGGFTMSYRAEYATQSDYGSNLRDYRADYLLGEVGAGTEMLGGAIGYEVLGTDDGFGLRTPLATQHAFNGWGDLFLTTPGDGLRDFYLKATATFPRGWSAAAFFHRFESDRGRDLGDEWDLLVSWKINKQFTALAKAAVFESDSTLPDVTKFWAQVEFAF